MTISGKLHLDKGCFSVWAFFSISNFLVRAIFVDSFLGREFFNVHSFLVQYTIMIVGFFYAQLPCGLFSCTVFLVRLDKTTITLQATVITKVWKACSYCREILSWNAVCYPFPCLLTRPISLLELSSARPGRGPRRPTDNWNAYREEGKIFSISQGFQAAPLGRKAG